MANVRLRGAKMQGASVRRAELENVIFADADVRTADFRSTTLSHSNMERADMLGANLSESKVIACDLEAARLDSADLSNSEIRGANLKDVHGWDTAIKDGIHTYDVRNVPGEPKPEAKRIKIKLDIQQNALNDMVESKQGNSGQALPDNVLE